MLTAALPVLPCLAQRWRSGWSIMGGPGVDTEAAGTADNHQPIRVWRGKTCAVFRGSPAAAPQHHTTQDPGDIPGITCSKAGPWLSRANLVGRQKRDFYFFWAAGISMPTRFCGRIENSMQRKEAREARLALFAFGAVCTVEPKLLPALPGIACRVAKFPFRNSSLFRKYIFQGRGLNFLESGA